MNYLIFILVFLVRVTDVIMPLMMIIPQRGLITLRKQLNSFPLHFFEKGRKEVVARVKERKYRIKRMEAKSLMKREIIGKKTGRISISRFLCGQCGCCVLTVQIAENHRNHSYLPIATNTETHKVARSSFWVLQIFGTNF